MTKMLVALSIALFALTSSSFAAEPEQILKNMPTSFSGRYVWQDSKETYTMTLQLTDRKLGKAGEVEFGGMEYFVHAKDPSQKFDSKVRLVINARTLSFDMAEVSDRSPAPGFIAMVYTGKLSADLRALTGSWTGPDARKVTIDLTAAAR